MFLTSFLWPVTRTICNLLREKKSFLHDDLLYRPHTAGGVTGGNQQSYVSSIAFEWL